MLLLLLIRDLIQCPCPNRTQVRSYSFRELKFAREGLTWFTGIDVFALLHALAMLISSIIKISVPFPLIDEHQAISTLWM